MVVEPGLDVRDGADLDLRSISVQGSVRRRLQTIAQRGPPVDLRFTFDRCSRHGVMVTDGSRAGSGSRRRHVVTESTSFTRTASTVNGAPAIALRQPGGLGSHPGNRLRLPRQAGDGLHVAAGT